MAIHFYDAATPENVPSGVYAAVYVNGYAWPQSQVERMSHVIRISVLRESYWAKFARVLDIETGAAEVQDLPPFAWERWYLGLWPAVGYVNRSNWMAAYDACKQDGVSEPLWWVSTLDGTQYVELKNDAGIVIAKPWAVQYQGGMDAAYDLSVLHGVNNFVAV